MTRPFEVLAEAVTKYLEGNRKGSRFPLFYQYFTREGDVESTTIQLLMKEFVEIRRAVIEGLPFGVETVDVLVPVHETGYSLLFGPEVKKSTGPVIRHLLDHMVIHCELAEAAGGGLGKFSPSLEEIRKAIKTIRARPETFEIGNVTVKAVVFDSNNDLSRGRVADGLWEKFRVGGMVWVERGSVLLGFIAEMQLESDEWIFEGMNRQCIQSFAKTTDLDQFGSALYNLAGHVFSGGAFVQSLNANHELTAALVKNPILRAELSRLCSRWTLPY